MSAAATPRVDPAAAAAVAAVGGALAASVLGVLAAAGCLLLTALTAARRGRLPAWGLCAPAALLACPPPAAPPPAVRAGPARVCGRVVGPVQSVGDGAARLTVARGREQLPCIAADGDALRAAGLGPGAEVDGVGRIGAGTVAGAATVLAHFAPGALSVRRPAPPSPLAAAARLRIELQRRLLTAVPGREGPLLCKLVLGHGPPVDDALHAAHRATGLSHLLAVSGAHVGLLVLLLAVGWSRLLRLPLDGRAFDRVALPAVVGYGLLTGLDPPVLRAVLAFATLRAAHVLGRVASPAAVLVVPGAVTAVLSPSDVTTVSFALSYAAVVGLLLAGAADGRALGAADALRASAWATCTTAPITLLVFGQIAPWTILATPLLAPLVAAMLGAGLLLAGAAPALAALVPGVEEVLAGALRAAAWLYAECVLWIATLPAAPLRAPCSPPADVLVAFGALGVGALLAHGGRGGVLLLSACLCLPHFAPCWAPVPAPAVRLLDVGHGQACLGHLPGGGVVLVDCGSQGSDRRAARAVLDALRPRRTVDLLVLSHGDHDHVGGVPELLSRCTVRSAALPRELADGALAATLRAHGAALWPLAEGDELRPLPGVFLQRPRLPPGAAVTPNDRSLWTTLRLDGLSVLLPGDAGEPAVRAWLQRGATPTVDVLVLPHHGRPHPLAEPLLRATAPRLALVSGGDPDRASAQGARAAALGIPVLETAAVGAIELRGGDPPRVRTALPPPLRAPAR